MFPHIRRTKAVRLASDHLMARRRFPLRIWDLLHEPRVVTVCMILGYMGLFGGGLGSLLHPPSTIQGELGVTITTMWSWFFIIGGALGLVSAPRGIWWLERVALIAAGTAFLIYGSTIANLQITGAGSRWMQLGVLTWGMFGLIARWHRIHWAALDPTRGSKPTVTG